MVWELSLESFNDHAIVLSEKSSVLDVGSVEVDVTFTDNGVEEWYSKKLIDALQNSSIKLFFNDFALGIKKLESNFLWAIGNKMSLLQTRCLLNRFYFFNSFRNNPRINDYFIIKPHHLKSNIHLIHSQHS